MVDGIMVDEAWRCLPFDRYTHLPFPEAGKKLCIPKKCQIYTVKKDDSCYGIIEAYKNAFTMSQLVSWNVDINSGCDNLEMHRPVV